MRAGPAPATSASRSAASSNYCYRACAPAQAKALELYNTAVKQGHFRSPRAVPSSGRAANGDGGASPPGAGTPTSAAALAAAGAAGGAGFALSGGGAGGGSRGELNLHALTAGVAMLSLYLWLTDLRDAVRARGEGALPATLAIVTDAGNASKEQVWRRRGAARRV